MWRCRTPKTPHVCLSSYDITTIKALLDGNDDISKLKDRIYVVRNDHEVLYVGKVQSCYLQKRFQMHVHSCGPNAIPSQLGIEITGHEPTSHEWSVHVFTIDDCNLLLKMNGKQQLVFDVNTPETALIKHYHPRLNVQSNKPSKTGPRLD
jgi:hypothetical protein